LLKQVSTGLMAVATQKELQELNISLLLNPASWIEGMNDEADFDVLNLNESDFIKLVFLRGSVRLLHRNPRSYARRSMFENQGDFFSADLHPIL
jgi:hypothetical protein